MNRILPPLHEGHAPIFLHLAFEEAMEAYEAWQPQADEPLVELEGKPVPISAVFGRMRNCTDLLPARVLVAVTHVLGGRAPVTGNDAPTYAHAAFVLRAMCVARLRRAAG